MFRGCHATWDKSSNVFLFIWVRKSPHVFPPQRRCFFYLPKDGRMIEIFGDIPAARINRKNGCKSWAAEISPKLAASSSLQCMMGRQNDRNEHERFNGCSARVRRYQWLQAVFPSLLVCSKANIQLQH